MKNEPKKIYLVNLGLNPDPCATQASSQAHRPEINSKGKQRGVLGEVISPLVQGSPLSQFINTLAALLAEKIALVNVRHMVILAVGSKHMDSLR